MLACENLSKENFLELKALNKRSKEFNVLNEDIIKAYEENNYIKKFIFKRKIKILKKDKKIIGFIWYAPEAGKIIKIRSMYVKECSREYYNYLLSIVKLPRGHHFSYDCIENSYNFHLLKELNFNIESGAYIMKLDLNGSNDENLQKDTNNGKFRYFKKGRDENLRCNLQNQIFEDKERIPLSVHDIYFDLRQEYFLEDASGFIYYDDKPIGYGQIIKEAGELFIVNFGIIKEYRGKELGIEMLEYLIKIAKKQKNPSLKLKVDVKNKKAINLYEKMGFKKDDVYFQWQRY